MRINDFKGEVPARDVRLLPANYARSAVNVDLDKGTIRPLSDLLDQDPAAWMFVNEAGVDVVPANISGVNRLLVSGLTGYPEARQGITTRRWGVVAPATIPAVSVAGTPAAGAGVVDSPSYRYSFVTAWGEESALSDATMPVDVREGEHIALSNFSVPTLVDSGNEIVYIRVYRLASTETGSTAYQWVPMRTAVDGASAYDVSTNDITGISTQLYDVNSAQDALNSNLSDVAITAGWDPPPDGAAGGVEYTNGVYALFKNKTVYLSVGGYYYAFPASGVLDYTFETQYAIVGLGTYNHQLIVCTEAFPDVISGIDPASASRSSLNYHFPCLAKKSILSLPYGVFYFSGDGGVIVDGSSARLVTGHLFTRTQWQAYPLSDAICGYWRGKIFVFFSGQTYGFVLDLDLSYVIRFSDIGQAVTDVFVDPINDQLYLNSANGWFCWDAGTGTLSATYQTAIVQGPPATYSAGRVSGNFPQHEIFEVAKIENDLEFDHTTLTVLSGNLFQVLRDNRIVVDLCVWGDGKKAYEQTALASAEAFRLRGLHRAREWYMDVDLAGSAEIYALLLARNMEELRRNG